MNIEQRKARLREALRKTVRAATRMDHSTLAARTFHGQEGTLVSVFADQGEVLGAVSFRQGLVWVDDRDLVIKGGK